MYGLAPPCGAAFWTYMHKEMTSKTMFMAALLAAMAMPTAAQRSMVAGVERARLLVDSRYDVAPDSATEAFMRPYVRVVDSIMSPVVGRTEAELGVYRPESPLSNLLADILLWAAKDYGEEPVMAVYNMGGMRASLPKGDVTYGDVLQVAPFENKICFLTLTGDALMQLFDQMAAVGGEGVSRGVELVITRDGRLKGARLGGKEIDPAASYRIATIDYLAEGNDRLEAFKLKTALNAPRAKENDTRFIISAYFREKASRGQAVRAQVEGRIRVE